MPPIIRRPTQPPKGHRRKQMTDGFYENLKGFRELPTKDGKPVVPPGMMRSEYKPLSADDARSILSSPGEIVDFLKVIDAEVKKAAFSGSRTIAPFDLFPQKQGPKGAQRNAIRDHYREQGYEWIDSQRDGAFISW